MAEGVDVGSGVARAKDGFDGRARPAGEHQVAVLAVQRKTVRCMSGNVGHSWKQVHPQVEHLAPSDE